MNIIERLDKEQCVRISPVKLPVRGYGEGSCPNISRRVKRSGSRCPGCGDENGTGTRDPLLRSERYPMESELRGYSRCMPLLSTGLR